MGVADRTVETFSPRDFLRSDLRVFCASVVKLPGTERLVLRWNDRDLVPFARLNADPRVMEYLPAVLTAGESDALAHRSAPS